MNAPPTHPPAETLREHALGLLDEASAQVVRQHLAVCPDCASLAVTTVHPPPSPSQTPTSVGGTGDAAPAAVPAELVDHERYRVLELIGKGGMGAVYRAEHRQMGRHVAIKILRPDLLRDPDSAARFHREIRAAALLDHENVVRAYDADRVGDLHFLIMEFINGTPLDRLCRQRGPLPVREACSLIIQAARGLQYAHEKGLVHRDLKPGNLLVTPDGRVKILDFGLARLSHDAPAAESEVCTFLGTADYAAPEQGLDPHSADGRADVYSLGCTLYYLLVGQPPFPGGGLGRKLKAHQTQPLPDVAALRPDVPAGLGAVLRRMTAKEPAERYQTPAEVAAALEPFLQPPRRRWRRALVAAGLLACLAAVLAGTIYVNLGKDKGTLEISTEDDDVEVVVKRGGKTVVILDKLSGRSVELRDGEYVVELGGKGEGLRLSTDTLKVQRGKKTIVEVRRLPAEKEKDEPKKVERVEKKDEPAKPKVILIEGGVTVAQDGTGQYRTIAEALRQVKAGQTVRILDDAVYREAVALDDPDRHAGLRLEAPKGATLHASSPARMPLLIDNVANVSVSGLRIRASDLEGKPLVLVKGKTSGVTLDGLDLEADARMLGIVLLNVRAPKGKPPVVVRRCTIVGNWDAIAVMTTGAEQDPEPSQGVLIHDNRLTGAKRGIIIDGPTERAWVVGNLLRDCRTAGLQLQDVWSGAREILVANNTVVGGCCMRVWQNPKRMQLKAGQVRFCGNVLFEPEWADVHALVGMKTGGGEFSKPLAKEVTTKWEFDQNWRDVSGKEVEHALPLSAKDHRLKETYFASLSSQRPDYLRPAKNSPLATGGTGGDLPKYAGALPPEGEKAWDWGRTWELRAVKKK